LRTSRERVFDRVRYIAGVLFNPRAIDYETFNLPQPLVPLYPLFRAARLTLKYATAPFNGSKRGYCSLPAM